MRYGIEWPFVAMGQGAVISEDDRDRLRSSSAFRRAVWGLRFVTLTPVLFLLIFAFVALGVPPDIGEPFLFLVFGSGIVGVGLVMSSMIPLEKIKKVVLAKYQLNHFDIALLMNGTLFRDVFRRHKPPGTPNR